jgi:SpoIIAA-like
MSGGENGATMIEIIEGFPDNVVGASAKGYVTKSDYDDVLIPKIEAAFKRHDRIRFYYELGPQFVGYEPGAMWEDFTLGFGHLGRWERIAVVTDAEWLRHAVNAFRFLMPNQVRVFANSESADARGWIVA